MKKCPYCAEEIQDAAIKCRYCGEVIVSDEWRAYCARVAQMPAEQRASEVQQLSQEQRETFELAWRGLGFDKAPEAETVATTKHSKKRSTLSGCWLPGVILSLIVVALFWGGGSDSSRSDRGSVSLADQAVEECKRLLLDRHGSRLRGRRFPPRRNVTVVRDGDTWEVLFLTRPSGAEFPMLSVGCEGMRRSGETWTAARVLIHE